METQELNPEISESQPNEQMAKKGAESVVREANGKFVPGHTKPGPGRPRTAVLSQALREILEREGAAKYANAIAKLATGAKRHSDRIAAFNTIADRTEGKPLQAMLVGHTIDESSVRTIAELLGKLTVQPALEGSDE